MSSISEENGLTLIKETDNPIFDDKINLTTFTTCTNEIIKRYFHSKETLINYFNKIKNNSY